jgi:hypothetical protein
MTMIAEIADPAALVAFDRAGATPPRALVASASARPPAPPSLARNDPSLVIVVPDRVDAIDEVGAEAGLNRGSNLLLLTA